MTSRHDAIVLGAGIVGISTAINLRKRGLSVALIDRREPGEETSFGNAGIIQREGVHPYLFPRDLRTIVEVALRRRTEANFHWSSLTSTAPFLWRYFRASTSIGGRRTFEANIQLFARCLSAHETLMEEAGSADLVAKRGWIRIFRDDGAMAAAQSQLDDLAELGLDAGYVDLKELGALEPHIETGRLAGGIHYRDPWTSSDPGALVKSYAELFTSFGGETIKADVSGMSRRDSGWAVTGEAGEFQADQMAVTLGPWSKSLLDTVGIRLPMGIKRGYHRHYRPTGNAYLSRPLVDDENGFVLAPMAKGIRLTSGAEFARHGAPKTPIQLERALPLARDLLPIGDSVEDEPWMGARPVFPDMLPVVGPAPGCPGLWLNFGHGHHGFTLGPATGELLAQMMTGEAPFCDPAPYRAERFG
ncbi:NAD(P)/FAD-dependent oxidoreductase [Oricola cellulosilytica]|uniref:FAD-binding oxidoreductase n=1 Tax=Oricola cellulosilytica TaxID=1429082 RepID=A0A4R0PEN7_9HYPH|nr:FAD-binding oxidoreductase [Oricola cellulosilytica]TCD15019.1 FAD-binding oxidoreductase [Oricola cellulosilytica]